MKSKKIMIILISVCLALVLGFSIVALFTVKKVEVDYTVSDNYDVFEIQSLLEDYYGKNMMFVDESDIKDKLKDYNYAEVVSFEKKLPNIINIKIRERREIYYFSADGKVYVTNEDGFVLKSLSENDPLVTEFKNSRDNIALNFIDIDLQDISIGSNLKSVHEQVLLDAFDIAKSVNLTDCIKSITIEKTSGYDFVDREREYDLYFYTYSGVKIKIVNFTYLGLKKTENAFLYYNNYLSDYQKAEDQIESDIMNNGNGIVTYKDHYIEI